MVSLILTRWPTANRGAVLGLLIGKPTTFGPTLVQAKQFLTAISPEWTDTLLQHADELARSANQLREELESNRAAHGCGG